MEIIMPFESEKMLSNTFLESPFIYDFVDSLVYPTIACKELKGLFGVPDIVFVNLSHSRTEVFRSFAFELKLANWKRALIQAYKYQSFADYSFVVLDKQNLHLALTNIESFINANVGLISVDTLGFTNIHFYPKNSTPYAEAVKIKFHKMILEKFNSYSPDFDDTEIFQTPYQASDCSSFHSVCLD
jgi:hypothetical protein